MPRNTAKLVNANTALRCLINKPATNNTTSSTTTKANKDAQSRNKMAHTDTTGSSRFLLTVLNAPYVPPTFCPTGPLT